uniref:G_PROTEIN_RECEP_F1_2 domain-containing protein n=1 Tax=Wuchereria bancrofti TaxID=6293 RepID=A0A1I8EZ67_WUCBA
MTYYMAADTVWGLGYAMCQFWLCLDYMMCNASVLNLLLISFDRYFSVTRPLTYRPRRTAKKAFMMIASTYIASALLWPPWIISWPYIEGRFTHPDRCVVQFIETNQFASVGTTIAAFWLPLNQHKKDKKKAQSNASTNSTKNSSVGRTKNSSSNFSSNKILQENNSLLTETISRAGGRISRKDKSSTYTVLIELKDSEEGQSRIRLSSCDSDIFEPARSEPDRIEDVRKNMVSQQLLNGTVLANKLFNEQRKSEKERRKNERKQESKAAKTLSAILLAFIITWTPYNVIVCWEAFYKDSIPAVYFHIAYFLCYINSTINPFCYAFCNPRFRLTYMRILTGNWKRQNTLGLSKMAFLNRS